MTLGPNSWKPWKWVDLVSKITKFLEKLSQALVAGTPGIPTQFPMCWKRHSRSSHGFDWRDVSIRAGLNGKLCVKHKNVRLKFDLCSLKKVFGFCHNMFPAGRYWWIFILNIHVIHVQYVVYFNWCWIYRFYLQIWGPLLWGVLFPGTPGFPQRVVPQDAAQDTWGRRFEGRGVGVLVEWQNKARREKKTERIGLDGNSEKVYRRKLCTSWDELKGFCFKNLQIINFSNKSSFRKAGETWKRC